MINLFNAEINIYIHFVILKDYKKSQILLLGSWNGKNNYKAKWCFVSFLRELHSLKGKTLDTILFFSPIFFSFIYVAFIVEFSIKHTFSYF